MNKKTIIILITLVVVISGFVIFKKNQTVDNVNQTAIEKIDQSLSANSQDDPFLGAKDAKVTIVQFADFECPYCRQEFLIIRELAKLYPQVKIIFRDLPLTNIHEQALSSAVAANCANKQNKFWDFHDQLFLNQEKFSHDYYQQIAKMLNLNMTEFNSCLVDKKIVEEISLDVNDAVLMGVKGTPTFFINGKRLAGVVSLENWKTILTIALSAN